MSWRCRLMIHDWRWRHRYSQGLANAYEGTCARCSATKCQWRRLGDENIGQLVALMEFMTSMDRSRGS